MKTLFTPVIHNLIPTDVGFREVQYYNLLINHKPKVKTTLVQYILDEKVWILQCKAALANVKAVCGVQS